MTEPRRADLHVHTCHSKVSGTLKFLGSRDCYSPPESVYRVAKARGMDYVAITDHDSIEGALELLSRRPDLDDVIVGEETSCWIPDTNLEVHFGVYGMTESLHRELQPLRSNAFDLAARLREAGVFFSLNHLLHFYRGQVPLDRYLQLLDCVPALEARNGTMLPAHNLMIEALVAGAPPARMLGMIGGSDAHSLRRVGRTWTSAPGDTRDAFLESLRHGLGQPGGAHGGTAAVAGDAYTVVASYVASLVGAGPRDHRGLRRLGCLAFAAITLPAQAIAPVIVAAARKSAERRTVRDVSGHLLHAARAIDEVLSEAPQT